MRYINKKDERLIVQEETCACGHSLEEHQGHEGACQGKNEESNESCACTSYSPVEAETDLVL